MPHNNAPPAGLSQQTLTLTSLAILKVDIDEGFRSYIDYLVTFVLSLLSSRQLDFVTDELVARLLENEFGLRIPIKAVQHVLRRMARKGYLRKEYQVFYPGDSLPRVDLSDKRRDASGRIQRVYDAICRFAPSIQPSLTWSNSDAANAVLGFLGRFAVECLKTYVFNTALPQAPETGPKELYVISRFIQHAYTEDRTLFEDFIVLVKGQMYANALTCPDLESLEKKFDNVTFYLDTPLILNLLGLQGEGVKQSAIELVTMIRELRGSIAVFEHSLRETRGVIQYAISNFDNPGVVSRVLREVRKSNIPISDLILCAEQLEEKLSAYHVRATPTPTYETQFQIDEAQFHEILEEEIGYLRNEAIMNDISSVRSIYALRRGHEPPRLEDSVAIFVTTNSKFARVAYEFGKTHNSTKEVSSVITDYSLANVAWLKAPMKRPSLPEKEMLALCYAALEPRADLFQKYVETMEQLKNAGLISENDHAILRLSPVAQHELMDLTLGEEEALTGNGVREILERAKESLVKEQKQLAAKELKTAADDHRQKEKSLLTTVELQNDIINTSTAEKDQLLSEQTRVLQTATRRARSVSRTITVLLMLVLSVGLLLGAAAGSGLISVRSQAPSFVKYALNGVVGLAVIWGWSSWITGRTVRSLTTQIEHRMTLKLFSWLTGKQEPPTV